MLDLHVVNENYIMLIQELKEMPFYRVDGGYRYGGKLLNDADKNPAISHFLNEAAGTNDEEDVVWFTDATLNDHIQTTLNKLNDLFISDKCFELWSISHKSADEIVTYHQIFEDLCDTLISADITHTVNGLSIGNVDANLIGEYVDGHYVNEGDKPRKCSTDRVSAMILTQYDCGGQAWERRQVNYTNTVLNHRNPFADISIKEQDFVYGSAFGQFETLQMITSHRVTKIEHDENTSFLALQPGFKVQKHHDCIPSNKSAVLFDDTISSQIVDDDTECYVYID